MRKKRKTDPLVTVSMLKFELDKAFKREFKPIVQQFKIIDRRFEAIDRRFEAIDHRFDAIDKRFDAMDSKFDFLHSAIDAFMKRTEDNELEIKLLGRQHDNLAKYCAQKIGYPTYGRNL